MHAYVRCRFMCSRRPLNFLCRQDAARISMALEETSPDKSLANAGVKICAFLNVCTATDAIRGSKKQWEQKAKLYVSQTITVT